MPVSVPDREGEIDGVDETTTEFDSPEETEDESEPLYRDALEHTVTDEDTVSELPDEYERNPDTVDELVAPPDKL